MKKLLFINSNVNRRTSRTNRLSEEFIKLLTKKESYDVTEIILEEENIQSLNSETLRKRIELSEKGEFSNEVFRYSRQFSEADCVVISAPYWELTYPAMLKNYIEAISVIGVTFRYGEMGKMVGMCKADKIYYITTSGGFIGDHNFGYDIIKTLGQSFGVNDTICITAEGLDIQTNDAEAILNTAITDLRKIG
jgi:Acyl carrier protein phosphodiesterase